MMIITRQQLFLNMRRFLSIFPFLIFSFLSTAQVDIKPLVDNFRYTSLIDKKTVYLDSIVTVLKTNSVKDISIEEQKDILYTAINHFKELDDVAKVLNIRLVIVQKKYHDNPVKELEELIELSSTEGLLEQKVEALYTLGKVKNTASTIDNSYYLDALKVIDDHNMQLDITCSLYLLLGDNYYKKEEQAKAIEYYLEVKKCVAPGVYSEDFIDACIGLGNIYNSIFDITEASNHLKEAVQHGIDHQVNAAVPQMKVRESLSVALTHFNEGSAAVSLALGNMVHLTAQTYDDDFFNLNVLRQLIYLNTLEDNPVGLEKAVQNLENLLNKEEIIDNYPNYQHFGQLGLAINNKEYQKAELLIEEFEKNYFKSSPILLKEQFLYLVHINDYRSSTKDASLNSFKKWNTFRDSVKVAFYKSSSDSLQIRYQKSATDKELIRLKSLNELDKSEIKYKNQNILFLSLIAIILAVLVLLIIYFLRKVKKQKSLVEILQKELHHRMKNNLSFIDLFINLAKSKFPDQAYQDKLNELQNRMHSMFEVHKQLFKTEDTTTVRAKNYIDTLVNNVQKVYANDNITIDNRTSNQETLLANTSFPVGLIVNEFVTNSYKYAFKEQQKGVIDISLSSDKSNYHLVLKDNGIGLPADFSIDDLDSFGLETIQLLTQEYKGTFTVNGSQGVLMNISLPKSAA